MPTTILKRNGQTAPFEPNRIRRAIQGAFWEHHNNLLSLKGEKPISRTNPLPENIEKEIDTITDLVVENCDRKNLTKVEEIENLVEDTIWNREHKEVSKLYIGFRQARKKLREEAAAKLKFQVVKSNGERVSFDITHLEKALGQACQGISNISEKGLLYETEKSLYDGVKSSEITEAMIQAARAFIEKEPNYSLVASRLLLQKIAKEALEQEGFSYESQTLPLPYNGFFQSAIERGVEENLLNPELKNFDLDKLAANLQPERDLELHYMGLKTLSDRYLIKSRTQRKRLELPQSFFMRVAMGLALNEKDRNAKAIEFYNILSQRLGMSSTPTLFNSGTVRSQLSSCFLYKIDDNIESILFNGIAKNGFLSKWAGGLGGSWTAVRGAGSYIGGTNGESNGIIPFLKIHNDQLVAVNQGGKRRGSGCAYLETWHIDIEEFLELRKETGDDRRRCHDMNTANWIPDLFMKRVIEDGSWWLFSPDKTPDLHESYGKIFEEKYKNYEAIAEKGPQIQHTEELGMVSKSTGKHPLHPCKKVSALALWKKMLAALFETGHPWITFKDSANIRSPQDHAGTIHSSNLCTEITLNTSSSQFHHETGEIQTIGETAVCNLASINIPAHIHQGKLNKTQLKKTVGTLMRMLDNVIDLNYYPVPEAKNANMRHRPVGLGIMGVHTALQTLGIPYDSQDAIDFADVTQELIALYAIEASCELAQEKGAYQTFKGSKWDRGIFPIDTLKLLAEERGTEYMTADTTSQFPQEWERLKEKVKKHGLRNSNTMAIAPTATIANICGVSEGIMPEKAPVSRKENLSGSFPVINAILVEKLKELNLWESRILEKIKLSEGSIQNIEEIPEDIRKLFKTCFEIHPSYLIECASRRQKWIDQGQSLNLFANTPNGQFLSAMYKLAWLKGLKSTYYLRTVSASQKEKTSIEVQKVGNTTGIQLKKAPKDIQACSIEAMKNGEICEACQ
jgi:ribonucleoside-diphosphate reductase alpha chain